MKIKRKKNIKGTQLKKQESKLVNRSIYFTNDFKDLSKGFKLDTIDDLLENDKSD